MSTSGWTHNMENLVTILLFTLTLVKQSYCANNETEEDLMKDSQYLNNALSANEIKSLVQHANRNKPNVNFDAILLFERIFTEDKAKLLESTLELGHFGIPSENIISDEKHKVRNCSADVRYVITAARMRLQWALDMIDSAGKPESGILRGNTHFVGDYDECMDVETGLDFDGQYCTTNIVISAFHDTSLAPPLQFQLGVCFPSSCHATDVEECIIDYVQSRPNITATATQTFCQERNLDLTTKAKIVISICSFFVTLMALGTSYDVFYKRWWLEREKQSEIHFKQDISVADSNTAPASKKAFLENTPITDSRDGKTRFYSGSATAVPDKKASAFYSICDQLLMPFSVYTNTSKLFAVEQSQGSIVCIHGMRFLSTTGIILFHTFQMNPVTHTNSGPFLDDAYNNWAFMSVLKADVYVDTFFAMSGVLLVYGVLKKLIKEEPTPQFFGTFYLRRVLRLTPAYMLILMTQAPLMKYISNGPLWPQQGFEIDECKDTWWTNLLYVNNFVKMAEMCMPWSWYLACDMQFYLVSPLLFLPMFYYEWKGLVVPFVFLLGNAICSGVITYSEDLLLNLDNRGGMAMASFDTFKYYYAKPYTRIGPYIVGIMTGFLLHKFQSKARLSKFVVFVGWALATAIALSVLYGLSGQFANEDAPSKEVRALYNALHRIAWGTSVCWIIFACANGYGGFVNTLLSWNVFIPLSRLSYCAYLVHPLVVKYFFHSQRKMFYANYLNLTFANLAMVTLGYAVAYVAYMAYEVPLSGLDKIILSCGWRKSVKK